MKSFAFAVLFIGYLTSGLASPAPIVGEGRTYRVEKLKDTPLTLKVIRDFGDGWCSVKMPNLPIFYFNFNTGISVIPVKEKQLSTPETEVETAP